MSLMKKWLIAEAYPLMFLVAYVSVLGVHIGWNTLRTNVDVVVKKDTKPLHHLEYEGVTPIVTKHVVDHTVGKEKRGIF